MYGREYHTQVVLGETGTQEEKNYKGRTHKARKEVQAVSQHLPAFPNLCLQ